MSFIDKNLSQKNGHGPAPETKSININIASSSVKTRQSKKIKLGTVKKQIKKNWRLLLSLVIVVVISLLAYGYISTKNDLNKLANPKVASEDAKKDLLKKVGLLIDLPAGETPSTATVSDVSKLKNQEFFARAQNGDKVLVFPKSGRAVLYRPSTNKVVEYSKVNLNPNQ